jgi:hypothetical protein
MVEEKLIHITPGNVIVRGDLRVPDPRKTEITTHLDQETVKFLEGRNQGKGKEKALTEEKALEEIKKRVREETKAALTWIKNERVLHEGQTKRDAAGRVKVAPRLATIRNRGPKNVDEDDNDDRDDNDDDNGMTPLEDVPDDEYRPDLEDDLPPLEDNYLEDPILRGLVENKVITKRDLDKGEDPFEKAKQAVLTYHQNALTKYNFAAKYELAAKKALYKPPDFTRYTEDGQIIMNGKARLAQQVQDEAINTATNTAKNDLPPLEDDIVEIEEDLNDDAMKPLTGTFYGAATTTPGPLITGRIIQPARAADERGYETLIGEGRITRPVLKVLPVETKNDTKKETPVEIPITPEMRKIALPPIKLAPMKGYVQAVQEKPPTTQEKAVETKKEPANKTPPPIKMPPT